MKAMLFGSFDGLHTGHHNFIQQAQEYVYDLVIVLARDCTIKKLKGNNPCISEKERQGLLKEHYPQHTIVLGDDREGSWQVIKEHQPECIFLGYDQDSLEEALLTIQEIYHFELIKLKPFHPEKYKSSILNKK